MENLKTPVLLIVYKRLDTLQRVFSQIRKVKPEKLYIASDGPKENGTDDEKKVEAVRNWLEAAVDWPCEVYKRYSEINQGCQMGPIHAIDWIFQTEESAIIIEDDIVADTSFFFFCQEMLNYYNDDKRVMMISGYKRNDGYLFQGDYCFSYLSSTWGWATWRRAWRYFDSTMTKWPDYRDRGLLKTIFKEGAEPRLTDEFDAVYEGRLDAWDYQWDFARYSNSGLGIVPKVNLIKNIGFEGEDATHTQGEKIEFRLDKIEVPCKKEENVIRNWEYDLSCEKLYFKKSPIRRFVRKHMPESIMKRWYYLRGVKGY